MYVRRENSIKTFVHVIPYHGIGGVEIAAATMINVDVADFNFKVYSISNIRPKSFFEEVKNFIKKFKSLISEDPDFLIISLWRSCIFGIVFKIFRTKTKLILFLHSANDIHLIDWALNRIVGLLAYRVWADCTATIECRMPSISSGKSDVISFRTSRLRLLAPKCVNANFIYWGRLHPIKKLERAIDLFNGVHRIHENARFTIIGPDDGDLENLKKRVEILGLGDSVDFIGPLDIDQIREFAESASFFLQTSTTEGVALSVMEAMQFGLVPIVTPVGEIAKYTKDFENSIIVRGDEDCIKSVNFLIEHPDRYKIVSENAAKLWINDPLYSDSVLAACRRIIQV